MRDWLRPQWPGIKLLLAVVLALIAGFIFGVRWAVSMDTSDHRRYLPPVPDTLAFRRFEVPEASPRPIVGLHEYAVPLTSASSEADAPAPTATPRPVRSARPTRVPAAGQSLAGSGSGYIHPAHQRAGTARWHATGRDGWYAAAGCALRRAIGPSWRGSQVLVAYGRRLHIVILNDVIGRLPNGRCSRTLIDLSDDAFRYFAPLSRGVLRVVVEW